MLPARAGQERRQRQAGDGAHLRVHDPDACQLEAPDRPRKRRQRARPAAFVRSVTLAPLLFDLEDLLRHKGRLN